MSGAGGGPPVDVEGAIAAALPIWKDKGARQPRPARPKTTGGHDGPRAGLRRGRRRPAPPAPGRGSVRRRGAPGAAGRGPRATIREPVSPRFSSSVWPSPRPAKVPQASAMKRSDPHHPQHRHRDGGDGGAGREAMVSPDGTVTEAPRTVKKQNRTQLAPPQLNRLCSTDDSKSCRFCL
uniref:Uncharacterized protein n=1 Tax=Chelonoidis abingdonii TaxID=106734 RepID=A0A8C0GWA0_CHEAB